MKKRDKEGISSIMTTIFLIVLATVSIISFYQIIKDYNVERVQMKFNCIKDVNVEILDACHEDNTLKIKMKNNEDIILGDFFLVVLYFDDGTSEEIPTAYNTFIMPYETKIIVIPYYEGIIKMKVVPRIEEESYLCREVAPDFKNIEECENETPL